MMQALVFWIAICFSCALGACVLAGLACKTGEKLRALRRCGWALVLVAAVAVFRGGAKSILNRFTADAGLTVTSAEIVIPTNAVDNATLAVSWAGPDGAQDVHVREAANEAWEDLGPEWVFDGRTFADGTNTAAWHVAAPASNIVPRAHYHLGSDLPPVEIEGDGVAILDFQDSSTNVVIRYAIDGACLAGHGAGTVRVEVQERGAVWTAVSSEAVTGGVTNTFTIPGFWVGRDTRWRVRLEVEQ